MTIPKIYVTVEPSESEKVVYLPMAPINSQAKPRGRIMLHFQLTNGEDAEIQLEQVTVSFPQSSVKTVTRAINRTLHAAVSQSWWFQNPEDHIVFDLPAPSQIKFSFQCKGFPEPRNFMFGLDLAPHVSPVQGGAYLFPGQCLELAVGEFWKLNGCSHGVGDHGKQSFGYDMGVWGANHDEEKTYGWVHPDKDDEENCNYRVWGKSVLAMADGIVLEALNDCPDNPVPLKWTSAEELSRKMESQREKYWGRFANGAEGNHLYIQHGDEVILYGNLQQNSLNPALLAPGSVVRAGDYLGLAGNAGNSTSPHLHIHAQKGNAPNAGPLRPIIFRNCFTIDEASITTSRPRGFWVKIEQKGLPEGPADKRYEGHCLVWPSEDPPRWPEVIRLSVMESDYQSLFKDMSAHGLRPIAINAYNIGRQTFFNAIFRPIAGTSYICKHGLDGRQYQHEFDKWVNKGFRLLHIESYYSHCRNKICYAPLFIKAPGPSFIAYHGKTMEEHEELLSDYSTTKGLVPVIISVVSVGDDRYYTAVFEKEDDVSYLAAHSRMKPAYYQQRFIDLTRKGLSMAYLNVYSHLDDLNFVCIWYARDEPSRFFALHHLDEDELRDLVVAQRKANLTLRSAAGYERHGTANFAAVWS